MSGMDRLVLGQKKDYNQYFLNDTKTGADAVHKGLAELDYANQMPKELTNEAVEGMIGSLLGTIPGLSDLVKPEDFTGSKFGKGNELTKSLWEQDPELVEDLQEIKAMGEFIKQVVQAVVTVAIMVAGAAAAPAGAGAAAGAGAGAGAAGAGGAGAAGGAAGGAGGAAGAAGEGAAAGAEGAGTAAETAPEAANAGGSSVPDANVGQENGNVASNEGGGQVKDSPQEGKDVTDKKLDPDSKADTDQVKNEKEKGEKLKNFKKKLMDKLDDGLEDALKDKIKNPKLRRKIIDHIKKKVEEKLGGKNDDDKSTAREIAEKLAEFIYRLGMIIAGKGDPGHVPMNSGMQLNALGGMSAGGNFDLDRIFGATGLDLDGVENLTEEVDDKVGNILKKDGEEITADEVDEVTENFDDMSEESFDELVDETVDRLVESEAELNGITDEKELAELREKITGEVKNAVKGDRAALSSFLKTADAQDSIRSSVNELVDAAAKDLGLDKDNPDHQDAIAAIKAQVRQAVSKLEGANPSERAEKLLALAGKDGEKAADALSELGIKADSALDALSGKAFDAMVSETIDRIVASLAENPVPPQAILDKLGLSSPVDQEKAAAELQKIIGEAVAGGRNNLLEFSRQAEGLEQANQVIASLTRFVIQDKKLNPGADAEEIAKVKADIAGKLAKHVEKYPPDLSLMAKALAGNAGTDASVRSATRFLRALGVETPSVSSNNIFSASLNALSGQEGLKAIDRIVQLMVKLMMAYMDIHAHNREVAVDTIESKLNLGLEKAGITLKMADRQLEYDLSEVSQQIWDMAADMVSMCIDMLGLDKIPVVGSIISSVLKGVVNIEKGIGDMVFDTMQAYMKHRIEEARAEGEETDARKDAVDSTFQLVMKDMDMAIEMARAMFELMKQLVQMMNEIENKAGAMNA